MPYVLSAKIEGLKPHLDRLREIPKRIKKKALRKGVSDAMKTLKWAARARVPKRLKKELPSNYSYKGGQLKKSLGEKIQVKNGAVIGILGARQNFRIEVGVTTRKGHKNPAGTPIFVNPAKYLHLVELGTGRGVRGTHFMRDTMAANRGAIMDGMIATIDAAIREVTG